MSEKVNDYLAHHDEEGQNESAFDAMVAQANEYLEHHGIKNQKHGVRRFQNYDGSLTPEGRIRYGVGAPRKKKGETSKASGEKTGLVKKLSGTYKKSQEEKLKEALRRHPKQIYRYRDKLTQDDLDEIMKKVEWDRKCEDIKREEIRRGTAKINEIQERMKSYNSSLSQAVGIYNNAALVYNGILKMQERNGQTGLPKPLPQLKWGGDGDSNKGSGDSGGNKGSGDNTPKKGSGDNTPKKGSGDNTPKKKPEDGADNKKKSS